MHTNPLRGSSDTQGGAITSLCCSSDSVHRDDALLCAIADCTSAPLTVVVVIVVVVVVDAADEVVDAIACPSIAEEGEADDEAEADAAAAAAAVASACVTAAAANEGAV